MSSVNKNSLALLEELELQTDIIDTIPVFIIIIDKEGFIKKANIFFINNLNVHTDQMRGKSIRDFFSPMGETEEFIKNFDKEKNGQNSSNFIEKIIIKEKELIIEWKFASIKNSENIITHFLLSGVDVTDLILTEKVLVLSHQMKKQMMNNMPEWFIDLNLTLNDHSNLSVKDAWKSLAIPVWNYCTAKVNFIAH